MAIAAIGAAVSAVGGLFGGNKKDDERIAKNTAMYNAAVGGNKAALTALGAMADILPDQTVPGYGLCGGWATSTAKKDAANKYNAAIATLGGMPVAVDTRGGVGPTVSAIAGTLQTIGDVANTAAGSLGSPGQSNLGQAVDAAATRAKTTSTLLIVASLLVGGYVIYKFVK